MTRFAALATWLAVLVLTVLPLAGCATGATLPEREDTLMQVSTVDALIQGVYDGVMTFETLRTYGDFGIGTLDGLDGEMLALDGRFLQVTADGAVHAVPDTRQTPFAAVTFFEADSVYAVTEGLDLAGFEAFLDSKLDTVNTFYAVRIDGTFTSVKTRSVPAQSKPYPPLAEVTANQAVFEFAEIAGTVVGFRCPPFVAGVNVPGYHLHFISADEAGGGHVLGFTTGECTVSVDVTRDFLMVLADADSDFYQVDLTPDNQEALEQAEK